MRYSYKSHRGIRYEYHGPDQYDWHTVMVPEEDHILIWIEGGGGIKLLSFFKRIELDGNIRTAAYALVSLISDYKVHTTIEPCSEVNNIILDAFEFCSDASIKKCNWEWYDADEFIIAYNALLKSKSDLDVLL
jgi:hypothetical protein